MPAEITPLAARMAFASIKGINRSLALNILGKIHSEDNFFRSSERQLSAVMGFAGKIYSDTYRASLLENARQEEDFIRKNKIRTIYFTDPEYPSRLAECEDAPLMLFALGDCDFNACLTVGIVGTRHATPYGLEFTSRLVGELSEKIDGRVAIVSGLAYGIDIAAHKAALQQGCPTVAVLAHGLNTIYPATHRSTAVDIVRTGGALLTDYTSKAAIHKGNFLARNRIVAGLCDCLVVVESAEKGGALVTARIAGEYDREVMALPGRITDRYSDGCNKLIRRDMASLITSADDLIDRMNWPRRAGTGQQKSLFSELSPEESTVVDYLREKSEGRINNMTVDLDISISKLTALLIELEFKGIVTPYPGAKYRLSKIQ